MAMVDIRHQTLIIISTILLIGTIYSAVYDTYLDTSNPLLSHLPHKLSNSHYFALKSNPINVYFIKKAWGWTTAAFFLLFFSSPAESRTKDRVIKYLTLTAFWLAFTSWFFGPALIERVIVYSGGECVFPLPTGELITAPIDMCHTKSTVALQTHPELFAATGLVSPPEGWRAVPRLRKGHDISGHVFLLTMSSLFLSDQLRPSLRIAQWSSAHTCAVAANAILLGIWFLACYSTSVYFHLPFEKFTGYLLGVACFAVTQLPFFDGLSGLQVQSRPHNE